MKKFSVSDGGVTLQQGLTADALYAEGNYQKIEKFLLSGAYVNTRSGDGKTPLMVAVRHNSDPEIIKLLLRNGAKTDMRDEKGRTALMYAAGHSYPQSPSTSCSRREAGWMKKNPRPGGPV